MKSTQRVIDDLSTRVTPATALRPPWVRASAWLSFSAAGLVLLAIIHPVREDFAARLAQPGYVACAVAALATGVLAAFAAFQVSIPDRSRRWMMLPVPTLVAWLGIVFVGPATRWIPLSQGGISLGQTLDALATLGLVGAPMVLSLLLMMRYAPAVRPVSVSLLGGLAVGGIAAAAVCVFSPV